MITSDQIHDKEFTVKFRGYSDTEVDEYLDSLAEFIDNLSKENKELRERLKGTTDQLTYMKNLESTLRDTLVTAQRSADETTRTAKDKADQIIAAANAEAAGIVRKANAEAEGVRRQIVTLRQQADSYRRNFKMMLNAQLQVLEESGLGQEKAEGSSSARAAQAQMTRIDLAAEKTDAQTERRDLRDRPLTEPRRIQPIPQEEE